MVDLLAYDQIYIMCRRDGKHSVSYCSSKPFPVLMLDKTPDTTSREFLCLQKMEPISPPSLGREQAISVTSIPPVQLT